MKACCSCTEVKSVTEFHKNRSRPDGLHTSCKVCISVQNKAWRDANPEKKRAQRRSNGSNREYDRKYDLKRKYGLTIEEYEQMLADQGGVCAICEGVDTKSLAVDHCHTTGVVRGLLCSPCNLGLGNFRDDPSFLTAAVIYLS